MKALILVCATLAGLCLTQIANAQTTMELHETATEACVRARAEAQAVYDSIQSLLDVRIRHSESEGNDATAFKNLKQILVHTDSLWSSYMERSCELFKVLYGHGTIGPTEQIWYRTELTINRRLDLEYFLNNLNEGM